MLLGTILLRTINCVCVQWWALNGGKSFEFSFNVCMLENYECGSKKQKERLQKRACRRINSIHPCVRSLLSGDHLPAVFDWFLRFYICIIIKFGYHPIFCRPIVLSPRKLNGAGEGTYEGIRATTAVAKRMGLPEDVIDPVVRVDFACCLLR